MERYKYCGRTEWKTGIQFKREESPIQAVRMRRGFMVGDGLELSADGTILTSEMGRSISIQVTEALMHGVSLRTTRALLCLIFHPWYNTKCNRR